MPNLWSQFSEQQMDTVYPHATEDDRRAMAHEQERRKAEPSYWLQTRLPSEQFCRNPFSSPKA